MNSGKIINEDRNIKDILENARTIAILGLSPKPDRDSNIEHDRLCKKNIL